MFELPKGRRSCVELLFPPPPPGREAAKLPVWPGEFPPFPKGMPAPKAPPGIPAGAQEKLWSQQEAGWDTGEPRGTGPGGSRSRDTGNGGERG